MKDLLEPALQIPYAAPERMCTSSSILRSELRDNMRATRVDAQASYLRTGMGGWFPEVDASGVPIPSISKWFALEITKEYFSWVYDRGDTRLG